jgi:hypothetical protein
MDVGDIEEAARAQYNGTGDSFFSSVDFTRSIYQACLQLAREALCIEATYSTTTVAGTQEYALPTNTISVKRITYEGQKLQQVNMREDDSLTLQNSGSTTQGTPTYYFIWDDTIYLRPIPAAAGTLKIFSYNEPSEVTTSSTIEVPSEFHMDLVEYVLYRMYAKDKDLQMAQFHREHWETAMEKAKRWYRRRKRGDAMPVVQDEETLGVTSLGSI